MEYMRASNAINDSSRDTGDIIVETRKFVVAVRSARTSSEVAHIRVRLAKIRDRARITNDRHTKI